jgi:hypothetical protein
MAKPFLYRCPMTGLNVQGITSDDDTDPSGGQEDRRVMVQCLACGGVHLVDPANAPKPPAEPE